MSAEGAGLEPDPVVWPDTMGLIHVKTPVSIAHRRPTLEGDFRYFNRRY